VLLRVIFLILVPRNYDPTLHPFEVPREYVRALNATKLERVFAKPFLASLDGHRDGVNCLAKYPKSLATVLSGACDGEASVTVNLLYYKYFSFSFYLL
jgi:WD repeat and SOF domain-containing protein 1